MGRFKHSKSGGGTFTPNKIVHSDQEMRDLSTSLNQQIQSTGGIYVYYQGDDITNPKVICISKDNPAENSNNTWYKAGMDPNKWSKVTTGSLTSSDPNNVQESELNKAGAKRITPIGCNYVIKLDKRPGATGNIQYRTKRTDITITKTSENVPQGYTAYIHTVNIAAGNKIIFKHNGNKLTDVTETETVSKIFVYYKDTTDSDHKFPLIVCVKRSPSGQTYYKRGQTWSDAGQPLNGVDPDGATAGDKSGKLASALTTLKDKYEIKLERINIGGTYTATPEGTTITVTEVTQKSGTDYKGFRHPITTGQKINRITIHGHITEGIPQTEIDGFQVTTANGGVYVYFTDEDGGTNGKREKPLLICLSKDYTKNNHTESGNNIWYKRKKEGEGNFTWERVNDTTYNGIKLGGDNGTTIDPALVPKLGTISNQVGSSDPGYPSTGHISMIVITL